MTDHAGLLATFASASACIDRLARTIPTEYVEIVDDPIPWNHKTVRRSWTGAEEVRLIAMHRQFVTGQEMADRLGRSLSSVQSRLNGLRKEGRR